MNQQEYENIKQKVESKVIEILGIDSLSINYSGNIIKFSKGNFEIVLTARTSFRGNNSLLDLEWLIKDDKICEELQCYSCEENKCKGKCSKYKNVLV